MHARLLIPKPALERRAEIPAGAVFKFAGRALRVFRVYGDQPSSVVIVEELTTFKGQFALWSAEAVSRVLNGEEVAPWR
jgi:hypothetical protein